MHRLPRPRSPQDVLVLCREHDVQTIELRFSDLHGRQHGVWLPSSRLSKQLFEDGVLFHLTQPLDVQLGELPELLLLPRADTVWINPLSEYPTAVLLCEQQDPVTREESIHEGRAVARRAAQYLQQCGVADVLQVSAELSLVPVTAGETEWAMVRTVGGREAEVAPAMEAGSSNRDALRSRVATGRELHRMIRRAEQGGIEVEHCAWDARFPDQCRLSLVSNPLVAAADYLNIVELLLTSEWYDPREHGTQSNLATRFRIQGIRLRLRLLKADTPLLAGYGYAALSEVGLHAIGGLLRHLHAIQALTVPHPDDGNDVSGATPRLGFAQAQSSAVVRVAGASPDPHRRQIELQLPTGQFNRYIVLAAVAMAVADGILNKVSPDEPLDGRDGTRAADAESVPPAYPSYAKAREALDTDYGFLTRGDVFSEQLLRAWLGTPLKPAVAE